MPLYKTNTIINLPVAIQNLDLDAWSTPAIGLHTPTNQFRIFYVPSFSSNNFFKDLKSLCRTFIWKGKCPGSVFPPSLAL